jgi:isoleucyl-tRNA synthetase
VVQAAHQDRKPTKERIAVWTTTPWTLPSNLGLAVGPDIEYAVLEKDGEKAYVGAARLEYYAKDLEGWTRTGTVKGSKLAGRRYTPLFDYLVEQAGPNAYRVLPADFVTTEDGTGVVHCAPAFGEDDQLLCNANGIPTVVTVDDHTKFTALVPDYQGTQVFEANKPITRDLKQRGSCSSRTRTRTRTRTAGGATPRWSTRRCRRGSWRSPSSRTAWSS